MRISDWSSDVCSSDLDLGGALRAFGQATNQQIIFADDVVHGKRSGAVSGRHSADDALRQLLAGTGLVARKTRGGMYTLEAETAANADTGGAAVIADSIVVTGSRIRRSATQTSAPKSASGKPDLPERGYVPGGEMPNRVKNGKAAGRGK